MKRFFVGVLMSMFFAASCFGKATETVELFNGKDLSNWEFCLAESSVNPAEIFSVENCAIRIKGRPFGYMSTKAEYGNFKLHIEWRYPKKASNSGIFLFVQKPAKVWPNAVECQLCGGKAGDFVLLGGSDIAEYSAPEGKSRPKFPVVAKFSDSSENPVGEWNCADIECRDGSITVYINGVLQNIGSKSPNKVGSIALQSEGGEILFRHVRLTPIK